VSSVALLLLSLRIGVVAGLRALTAPAVVAWAIHLQWLDLHDSPLSFLGSTAAVVVLTLLALGELVTDKLPSTPSRLDLPPLTARIVLGGLTGAILAAAHSQSFVLGCLLGAVGALAGAFAGYTVRSRLVRALGVPDPVIACLEDLVAVGGGLLTVLAF
jgi:uncharacterized membrane protein